MFPKNEGLTMPTSTAAARPLIEDLRRVIAAARVACQDSGGVAGSTGSTEASHSVSTRLASS